MERKLYLSIIAGTLIATGTLSSIDELVPRALQHPNPWAPVRQERHYNTSFLYRQ